MDFSIRNHLRRLLAACMIPVLGIFLLPGTPVSAASDAAAASREESTACFTAADFQQDNAAALTGIFVTGVPKAEEAALLLGERAIVPGDVLPVSQLENLTVESRSLTGGEAVLTYLPICGRTVEKEASVTIPLAATQDKAPEAKDGLLETYKNLENTGKFNVVDEEGSALTYTITRQPRRGTVTIQEDGYFLFTPKKNKVGKDYFTYTATDAAGNVSNEATITIEILKPTDDRQYTDITTGNGKFEAQWMQNTGIFSGTQIGESYCFQPEASVSRGEFLAMVMDLMELPVEDSISASGFADEEEAPQWMKPYLVSAMRMGLVTGNDNGDGAPVFRPNDPVTGAEAAVMLQNILMLGTSETAALSEDVPAWAEDAAGALAGAGITCRLTGDALTRMDTAKLLYQVSKLTETAPGLAVFQEQ